MILKVKKSQRTVALFDQSYSHLCYFLVYVLFTICLIECGLHRMYVDAYISHANHNLTNSFQQYRPHVHDINASHQNQWHHNRNGRFLFDAFFGIDTPQIEADDFADDDDDEVEAPKPCKCGILGFEFFFFFGVLLTMQTN